MIFSRIDSSWKIFVGFYVLLWLAAIAGSWWYWNQMHFAMKTMVTLLDVVLAPDIQSLKPAFCRSRS
ncbi:Uncharacterised protein [Delftia tsuruhatensis]|nr:Uncharacterised protein [Delftia tsuruhatensis]CAC9685854.1 Uncharacterised protein [Delftia tsuruhatensis]